MKATATSDTADALTGRDRRHLVDDEFGDGSSPGKVERTESESRSERKRTSSWFAVWSTKS
jgi:hypothetical protein